MDKEIQPKTIDEAFIFDVDGVITDLLEQKIKLPQILDIIMLKLNLGHPIAFITGRSSSWLQETVLSSIKLNKKTSQNFFISSEFGGVSIIYKNGIFQHNINREFSVPDVIRQAAMKILDEYDEFVMEDKKTLLTYKIKNNISLSKFKKAQTEALAELKALSEISKFSDFEIQEDTIAINIRNKKSTKYIVTESFLEWLDVKKMNPKSFLVFGDSDSDLEIGEKLKAEKKLFKFVFVGENLLKNPSFPIIKTKARYDKGTLEFLQQN